MFDDAILAEHARDQMHRRGVTEDQVRMTLNDPESVHTVREGRRVVHGIMFMGDPPREYLLRIFVDIDRSPPEIVTIYRTSKVAKYRRAP